MREREGGGEREREEGREEIKREGGREGGERELAPLEYWSDNYTCTCTCCSA